MPLSHRARTLLSRTCIIAGAVALGAGALGHSVGRTVFNARTFADRAAQSLQEPGVAAFVADRVTGEVLRQSPDLTAVRPLILVTVRELVSLGAMGALVRTAAFTAHETIFAEGTRRVVVSVPDVGVLLRAALERANPEVASRLPDDFETRLASLGDGPLSRGVLDLWQLRSGIILLVWSLFGGAVVLLSVGAWLAPDRRRGLAQVGVALIGVSLAIFAVLPLGRLALHNAIADPLVRGAAMDLWRVGLLGNVSWAVVLAGAGLLLGAAGSTLMDDTSTTDWLRRLRDRLATRPPRRWQRNLRALGLLALGGLIIWQPGLLLRGGAIALGIGMAFVGLRDLFREIVHAHGGPAAVQGVDGVGRAIVRTALAGIVLVSAGAIALLLRLAPNAPAVVVDGCNGHAELCTRAVDAVTFPGAHNAMSNAEIPDWLFPHHERTIAHQLEDGVRALLIDVHYGFPGAARIKTDLSAMRPTMDVVEEAVGVEGVEAAMRIRESLVGADEGRRGLYLCHGFCEVGGYPFEDALVDIRRFLVTRPGAVLLIVIEDYVSPEDLADAFENSGLNEYVYEGAAGPPWPTLRALMTSGKRVVVFLESGRSGVPWLRPAFDLIQETPYHFEAPQEFTCRPNRGETAGSLFQINHWIETTPAPRPSNAEIVNAYDFLLGRARQCQQERGMLPNVIAVDFYRTGDLFRVADALNGVSE